MSQQRQLREYQLVELMLRDRERFYNEFVRVAGEDGEVELQAVTDRDKLRAMLAIEHPVEEAAWHR